MKSGLGVDAPTWQRLNPLRDAALDLPPAQRDAWLEALPPQHADLKDLLRQLLARSGRIESAAMLEALPSLDTGAADATSETFDKGRDGGTHTAGESIGPYRLLRELGVGGMGTVWPAERTDGLMAQRQVALKLPFGPFRGDLAARIAREREILATLDHPHIARLYDAGVAADGQPFLALEHVDGQRIDHYCDQHHLDVPARLVLFLQVARAVAHAHAQLVIHRDIKPSNLLVNPSGQVKLLDFGIARLLGHHASGGGELTLQGARPFTPDYAAPEQVSGAPVDTRCDWGCCCSNCSLASAAAGQGKPEKALLADAPIVEPRTNSPTCSKPPKAKPSRWTTRPPALRCAVIRWRCCATRSPSAAGKARSNWRN